MTSSRLPGKVLAEIAGRPALAIMLDRVRPATGIDEVCVATTGNATDDPVATCCRAMGIRVFRGDENDVLGRYRQAAEEFDADIVVRLTADCPMIDPSVIDAVVCYFKAHDLDYASNAVQRTYPDGLDVEVFSREALVRADEETQDKRAREHVTLFMNGRRADVAHGEFRCGSSVFPHDFSHLRWTIDTQDDLESVRRYFDALPAGFHWLDAVAYATRHPELIRLGGDV